MHKHGMYLAQHGHVTINQIFKTGEKMTIPRSLKHCLLTAVVSLGLSCAAGSNANATLLWVEEGVYFTDTNTGYYWYTQVNQFVNQDWETANQSILGLNTGSLSWQMPGAVAIDTLEAYHISEDILEPMFFTLTNIPEPAAEGWLYDDLGDGQHGFARAEPEVPTWYLGQRSATYQNLTFGAFAYSTGGEPVPEPTTMLLFGSAMVGSGILRRGRRKKG